jgi:hypothetical protein
MPNTHYTYDVVYGVHGNVSVAQNNFQSTKDELVVVAIKRVEYLAAELGIHDTVLGHNLNEGITGNLSILRLLLEALENQPHLVLANCIGRNENLSQTIFFQRNLENNGVSIAPLEGTWKKWLCWVRPKTCHCRLS